MIPFFGALISLQVHYSNLDGAFYFWMTHFITHFESEKYLSDNLEKKFEKFSNSGFSREIFFMIFSEAEIKNNQLTSQPSGTNKNPLDECQNTTLFGQLSVTDPERKGEVSVPPAVKVDPGVHAPGSALPAHINSNLIPDAQKNAPGATATGDTDQGNEMDTSMKKINPDSAEFERTMIDEYVP